MCVGILNLSVRLSRDAATKAKALHYPISGHHCCLFADITWHWLSNEAENDKDQEQLTCSPQMFIAICLEDSTEGVPSSRFLLQAKGSPSSAEIRLAISQQGR